MNPILTTLSRRGQTRQNDVLALLAALKNGNPEQMLQQMMNTNPQFRQFVEANRGKSPEQIAQENGLDFNSIRNLLR